MGLASIGSHAPRSRDIHPPALQFISTVRKQLRADNVRVQVRKDGLDPGKWVVRDRMAITSTLPTRTAATSEQSCAALWTPERSGPKQPLRSLCGPPVDALLEMAEGSSRP